MARQKFWKDGLLQGVWVTTKGQVFNCGPKDMQFFHDRTKAMLSHGSPVPWTWEHQQDQDSDSVGLSASDLLARWAKNTGGHIHDVRISPSGPLQFLMDVDDADKSKLESIKFVSPDIRHNWRDRNGPEFDSHGPYWPGQSIAHLAVTPMPVQYPQEPFRFDTASAVSLSSAVVSVSLSAAVLRSDIALSTAPKGKSMPFPPEDVDKPETPNLDESLTPENESADPPPGGIGDDAHLIQSLSEIVKDLGIEVHAGPGMSLQSYVEHLCTAFKTHKATKGGDDDPATDDHGNPNDNPNNPQEPELAENAPIMMSAAHIERNDKLKTVILKQSTKELSARVGVLFQKGFIDESIRKKLANEIGNVKLSSVSDDGDLMANPVLIRIEAYEEQMKLGKPGPFAKASPTAKIKINPLKPISSAIALSAADDEVPEPAADDDQNRTGIADPVIINRLSGGRYDAYLAAKNGKAGV